MLGARRGWWRPLQPVIRRQYSSLDLVPLPRQVYRVAWARQVGTRVPRTECVGTVLQTYSRACTIALSDEGIVVLLAPSAGMVAHGIRLIEPLAFETAMRSGDSVWLGVDRLTIGRSLIVQVRAADTWEAELRPGMALSPFAADTAEALRELAAGGELLDFMLGRDGQSAICSIVGRVLPTLAVATQCGDVQAALQSLSTLVGLGPGLTPSGDDFIVGLLAGLSIGAATQSRRAFLHALCAGVSGMAAHTTPVSRQHLLDASELAFSERLSDVCLAVVRGLPPAVLLARAAAQLAVGASSGGDAMAGLVFALFECGVLGATSAARGIW